MNAEQIRRQQTDGFLTLRFEPTLETRYRQARSALIRQRARVVSIAGLLLFLVYALMDVMTLPRELAQVTAFIRLAFICPIIALVLWLSHCTTLADEIFEKVYTLAYLAGGMSVIAIIVAARMQAYPLPYEGMILMLMFGYFAEATTRRIRIDGVEISDAAWFSPRQLPSLPPPYSISRELIETHLARWREE